MTKCPHCGYNLGDARPAIGTPVEVDWGGWKRTEVAYISDNPFEFWVALHVGQAGMIPCEMKMEGLTWRRVPGADIPLGPVGEVPSCICVSLSGPDSDCSVCCGTGHMQASAATDAPKEGE